MNWPVTHLLNTFSAELQHNLAASIENQCCCECLCKGDTRASSPRLAREHTESYRSQIGETQNGSAVSVSVVHFGKYEEITDY